MLRSLDFVIQIIKFCIRGLLKYIAQETRQNVKWLGTTLSEMERTKLQGLNDLLLFLTILMFENEDCKTDGAVNKFRKQHDICSEEL